ncbi:MAG: DUF1919 domain-containing protein [Candidatus Bathyarchaeota archaeon]|nr:DUF1919 domain-containing protein [Candidatus Bathyarchaeota archaeon]
MDLKAFIKGINVNAVETNVKWNFIDRFFSWIPCSKLKNKTFSIIGNNCFTGGIYHKFGLQYNTPTIWTYIYPKDYLKLLENLIWYLKQPLTFKKETEHKMAHSFCEGMNETFPIGVLYDIEIHFMHYRSEQEAKEKWTRRVKRLNLNNLFVLFSDGDEFNEEYLERFEKMPYKNKIFFSSKPRSNKTTVFIRECLDSPVVSDMTRNRKYEKYLDLVKWLNGEPNFKKI